MLKKLWNVYSRIGVTPDLDAREIRRIAFTNHLLFIAIAYAIIRALLSLSDIFYSLKLLSTTIIGLSLLFLNFKKYHNVAKVGVLCAYAGVTTFFLIHYLGIFKGGGHLVLLILIPWPFMLFDMRQKKLIISTLTFIIGCLGLCILYHLWQPRPIAPHINPDTIIISTCVLAVVMLLFTNWHFASSNDKAEMKLLKEKEQSDAASHAKSQFLANMSHELRTPLNAILGFSQILGRSQHLDAQEKQNIHTINRSGEHLLALINDVLDMSKIESGQIILNDSDFDIYLMMNEVRDICKKQYDRKGLYLRFEIPRDLPRFVRGDETRLRQVLLNLLNNAVKFTNEGGVTVQITAESNSNTQNNAVYLQIEVKDTGVGIEANKTDQIFDPFVQNTAGMLSEVGTGLGLPISRKIAQLMHGDITVESQLGKGSCFKVEVRLERCGDLAIQSQKRHRQVIGLQQGLPDSKKNRRILIVDDIENNRQVLFQLISCLGFEIKEAENGIEAIKCWKAWHKEGHAPDLVWMDIRMPVMDGLEATREIKRLDKKKGQHTVVIAVSASAFDQDAESFFAVGCDDFVKKPFKDSEVFEKMKHHLGLAYIYQDTSADDQKVIVQDPDDILEEIKDLPLEWLNGMKEAAEQLDDERMRTLVKQIRDQHGALADMLEKIINQFDYEKIISLFQKRHEIFD